MMNGRMIAIQLLIAGLATQAAAVDPLPTTPPEVQAYVDGTYGSSLQVYVFPGDFSGDGEPDAVAFIYYAMGGTSFGLDASLFERRGGKLTHMRMAENVFGLEPRDVSIAPGHVEVTTTTLKAGDPRCCPTGETRFEIKP